LRRLQVATRQLCFDDRGQQLPDRERVGIAGAVHRDAQQR